MYKRKYKYLYIIMSDIVNSIDFLDELAELALVSRLKRLSDRLMLAKYTKPVVTMSNLNGLLYWHCCTVRKV